MDSCDMVHEKENCCPMFCTLKSVLFAVVIIFMLFLPLGDPRTACSSESSTQSARIVMCYLCEGYYVVVKAVEQVLQALHFVSCVVTDLLYEGKLKFYELLENMDKRDLCASVCCTSDDDLNFDESRENRCPQCKCVRKKCNRKQKADCRFAQL